MNVPLLNRYNAALVTEGFVPVDWLTLVEQWEIWLEDQSTEEDYEDDKFSLEGYVNNQIYALSQWVGPDNGESFEDENETPYDPEDSFLESMYEDRFSCHDDFDF